MTLDTVTPPDTALHLGEQSPVSVSADDDFTAIIDFGSPVLSGSGWELDAQPNWLLTPISFPEDGTLD